MALLGFKKQFAPMVAAGLKKQTVAPPGSAAQIIKRQTIRAKREDGRNPHSGDTLYLYQGLRTKQCRKLGEAVCRSVQEICVDVKGINLSGDWLNNIAMMHVVREDGFQAWVEFLAFFRKEHGLPFWGLLIKW